MRDNINKVSERGARLDSLQDKTDNLAVSAQGFRRGANRVRKQVRSSTFLDLSIIAFHQSHDSMLTIYVDVVEGYEDEDVAYRRYHRSACNHHRTCR
jgi:hypothetical protein